MRNGTGEPVRCFQKRSIRKYTAKAFKFTDKNLQPGLKKKKREKSLPGENKLEANCTVLCR